MSLCQIGSVLVVVLSYWVKNCNLLASSGDNNCYMSMSDECITTTLEIVCLCQAGSVTYAYVPNWISKCYISVSD